MSTSKIAKLPLHAIVCVGITYLQHFHGSPYYSASANCKFLWWTSVVVCIGFRHQRNKGVHPTVIGNISSIFTSRSTVGVSTMHCGRLVVICRLLQENSSVRVNYDTDGNVRPQTYNAACTSIELWIIILWLEHRLMREYNGRVWLVTRLPRSTVTAKRGLTSDICTELLKYKCNWPDDINDRLQLL